MVLLHSHNLKISKSLLSHYPGNNRNDSNKSRTTIVIYSPHCVSPRPELLRHLPALPKRGHLQQHGARQVPLLLPRGLLGGPLREGYVRRPLRCAGRPGARLVRSTYRRQDLLPTHMPLQGYNPRSIICSQCFLLHSSSVRYCTWSH